MDNIDDFIGGWFIGNFEPSLLKTNLFEVAVKNYVSGVIEEPHFHKIATEFTVIVSGKAKLNGKILSKGDIVKILPEEVAQFEALTDVITLVVKVPCVINDKFKL